ncbi:hypothetical protein DNTS_025706 [Danionella cerebrum]|uniref:DH domain-containing protein n=1 Tax=Danionella cerebrum TaxID=2873325 RepID=A0A553MTC6_9TELE|nr:hypothetical protein DNTS_025706 [Danionella translucida]
MKSQEGELHREISKVQGMVCELRAGFSRALLELNQIQQGDTELQTQLEDTRHGCNKRALHLESLVLSLKEELEEMRCQFRQLSEEQDRKRPENPAIETRDGVADRSSPSDGAAEAPPLSQMGGTFLIHSYLQGLQVARCADVFSCHASHSSLRRCRRRAVVEMLLQSERHYVTSLNQLHERYKIVEANVGLVKHEEQESLRLLTLLFAPVSRIHTYLSIIQTLLLSSGASHADPCSLQESERLLSQLCTSCHMTLEKVGSGLGEAGPEQSLRSRCCVESPDCAPSAFTKYCANSNADMASFTADAVVNSTVHQRKFCRVGISQTLPRPSGILRNNGEQGYDPSSSGWHTQFTWTGRGGHTVNEAGPVCVPFPRDPRNFLNPEGTLNSMANRQRSPGGLTVRVCGSPGLDGRVYTGDRLARPIRLDDGDTDCDVGDASMFDFSSETTCSPDDPLNRLRREEARDEEEEDSEVPVLLKPSYAHSSPAMQPGTGVFMPWQIPRRAPIPAEVRIGAQGKNRAQKSHRIPQSAFRPIWDPNYSQGDVTPAKENSVSFSTTNQIINQQQETDQSRNSYRGSGVQRAEAVWHDSEDSEGPCSTV